MNWADFAILAVVAISALVSVLRGFVREALSLLGWVLAFWVALSFTGVAAAHVPASITTPSVRHGLAFFALLVTTLVASAVVNLLAGKLVERSGLSGTDRTLGMIFGVARGLVIVAVLVVLAGLTAIPDDPWWRESLLIGHFQVLATEIRSVLPPDIAQYFSY